MKYVKKNQSHKDINCLGFIFILCYLYQFKLPFYYCGPEVKLKFLNRLTITGFVLNTLGNRLFVLCHFIIFSKRGSEK